MGIAGFAGATSILLTLAPLAYAVWLHAHQPASIEQVNHEEQRLEATKQRLDISVKLFDTALLFLGALWGLVLADKYPLKLSDRGNAVVFVCSNALILLSLLFNVLYRRRVSTLLWDLETKLPNIFAEPVDYLFRVQWMFFLCSLALGGLTFLLKGLST